MIFQEREEEVKIPARNRSKTSKPGLLLPRTGEVKAKAYGAAGTKVTSWGEDLLLKSQFKA